MNVVDPITYHRSWNMNVILNQFAERMANGILVCVFQELPFLTDRDGMIVGTLNPKFSEIYEILHHLNDSKSKVLNPIDGVLS